MKKYIFFLCLIMSMPGMASYENSCVLKGVIISEPKKDKSGTWAFEYQVDDSGKYGRTDSGCESKGAKISVTVKLENPTHVLKKGQVLWLRDMAFDAKNVPYTHEFSVLSETVGEEALSKSKTK